MRKMRVVAIALFGLPCWACRRRGMMGWSHSGISMRGLWAFCATAPGMGMMVAPFAVEVDSGTIT